MTNMSTLKTTGATGHRDLPLDELILYINNVLSNIRKKDSRKDVLYSGKNLKRLVQRFTSDHSKLVESISEGANKISDKELLKPKWSTVAREVTLAILKGLDIFQSPAAAVASVVANVAERFDEIPAIDRECIDLLEEMLESVNFCKLIKDRQLDLHIQRPLETISNAVESAVTGAIVCHSIIRWKTTTRLPLTKVIREELGYVKDKIRSSDQKLVHEICLLTFNKGGMEENRPPNQEESPSLRSSGLHAQEEGLSLEGDKWHWVVGIMVSVTLVKLALVKAFAQDHFFDVITNTIGLFAAVLASTFYWWIDPSGAIVVTGEKATSPKRQCISSVLDASDITVNRQKCKGQFTTATIKINGCDKVKVEADLNKKKLTGTSKIVHERTSPKQKYVSRGTSKIVHERTTPKQKDVSHIAVNRQTHVKEFTSTTSKIKGCDNVKVEAGLYKKKVTVTKKVEIVRKKF